MKCWIYYTKKLTLCRNPFFRRKGNKVCLNGRTPKRGVFGRSTPIYKKRIAQIQVYALPARSALYSLMKKTLVKMHASL